MTARPPVRLPARLPARLAVLAMLCAPAGACNRSAGAVGTGASAGAAADELSPEERAQQAAAELLGVAAGAVEIQMVDEPELPGVKAFRAVRRDGDGSGVGGVFVGDAVVLEPDLARAAVMRAAGFGSKDAVATAAVAHALAVIGSTPAADSSVVLDDASASEVPERWRRLLHAPRALSVDGDPALEFWSLADGRPPRLHLVVLRGDGSVEATTRDADGS